MAFDNSTDTLPEVLENPPECCEEDAEDSCQAYYSPCLEYDRPISEPHTPPPTVAGYPVPEGLENFPKEQFFQYFPPERDPGGFDLLPLYQTELIVHREKQKYSLECNKELSERWETFKENYPESIKTVVLPTSKDFRFVKGCVQYIDPALAEKHCIMKMKAGPLLDTTAQLPVPGDMHALFRAGRNIVQKNTKKKFLKPN